ncbi:MAG: hypothetical protein ED557_05425 [Balneola sp.]|nr:MAG: hypothetical protein ED557_05425 [Balneola sp.]
MYLHWLTKLIGCLCCYIFLSGQVFAQEILLSPANTTIEFEIKHLSVLTVKGSFNEFSGSLVKKDDFWMISGTVASTTINTNNEKRDETLRTDAYFDVEKYPQITFEGTGDQIEDGLRITGLLILKDLSAELSFQLLEKDQQLISEEIKLSRKEIGLSFDSMDMLIGDEVIIQITINEGLK